jgi:hypothetical protein
LVTLYEAALDSISAQDHPYKILQSIGNNTKIMDFVRDNIQNNEFESDKETDTGKYRENCSLQTHCVILYNTIKQAMHIVALSVHVNNRNKALVPQKKEIFENNKDASIPLEIDFSLMSRLSVVYFLFESLKNFKSTEIKDSVEFCCITAILFFLFFIIFVKFYFYGMVIFLYIVFLDKQKFF